MSKGELMNAMLREMRKFKTLEECQTWSYGTAIYCFASGYAPRLSINTVCDCISEVRRDFFEEV